MLYIVLRLWGRILLFLVTARATQRRVGHCALISMCWPAPHWWLLENIQQQWMRLRIRKRRTRVFISSSSIQDGPVIRFALTLDKTLSRTVVTQRQTHTTWKANKWKKKNKRERGPCKAGKITCTILCPLSPFSLKDLFELLFSLQMTRWFFFFQSLSLSTDVTNWPRL